MLANKISTECHRVETLVANKGFYMPHVTAYVNWIGYQYTLNLDYRSQSGANTINKFFHSDAETGFEELFAQLDAFVSDMPSIHDTKRNEFIAAVGHLIEQGRQIDIDVEFLNPLTDMMKKMSTNIITHDTSTPV